MVRAYTIADGTVAVRMREFAKSDYPPGKREFPASNVPHKGRVAVFLDRDGVINNNGWYINSPEEFALLPGAATAIRRLNEAGLPVVVVTNQGGVALRYVSEATVSRIHDRMDEMLAAEGAHVDAVYSALAHPEGTVPGLDIESPYRKPGTGMFDQASKDLGIALSRSTMIGDTTTDTLAGQRAGCRTILVKTGFAGGDGWVEAEPDVIADDLAAAVDIILGSPGS